MSSRSIPRCSILGRYRHSPDPDSSYDEEDTFSESSSEFSAQSSSSSSPRGQPKELHQPWSYMFEPYENVWVMTDNEWFYGTVITPAPHQLDPSRRLKKARWVVQYDSHERGMFAPLDGVMKPNTCHIRNLLRKQGYSPSKMAT